MNRTVKRSKKRLVARISSGDVFLGDAASDIIRRHGATYSLRKPLDPDVLLELVNHLGPAEDSSRDARLSPDCGDSVGWEFCAPAMDTRKQRA